MGGHEQNQDNLHQSVMEYIAGVLLAKQAANPLLMRLFVTCAAFGTVVLLYAALVDIASNRLATMGFGLVAISVPWLALVQRFALHITLHRHNLRLTNLLIGKRERDPKEVDFTKTDVELFAAAAGQVCNLAVPGDWQHLSRHMEAPGVLSSIMVSSATGQRYLCLYGEMKAVLALCGDIWDFGYTRSLAAADRERFMETARKWKKTHALPVAMAYLPLPDGSEPSMPDVSNATLLGLLNIQTTRGDRQIISVSPARSLYLSTLTQLNTIGSLVVFAVFNLLAAVLFSTPLGFGFWQFVLLGWFVLSIPVATLNWDQATRNTMPKTYPLTQTIWTAVLAGSAGFGSYVVHLFSNSDVISSAITRNDLQTASATALLTLGSCLLINLLLARSDGKHLTRHHVSNPLFLLGMLCAVLVLLTAVVLTGPLTGAGLLIAIGSVGLYLGIRKLSIYANTHHTRDHILELLHSSN